ncbi:hypothetical protein LXL04_023694 [Taraxacum kok-saghyz]
MVTEGGGTTGKLYECLTIVFYLVLYLEDNDFVPPRNHHGSPPSDHRHPSLHFFANEPVLMSTSPDNSIKMWIFDTTDGDPRLLSSEVVIVHPVVWFYANGRHVLSAGQDRAFCHFSVIQDQQTRELCQRHITKRAKKLKLKACTISSCGNFVVLGTAGGWIEKFNLHSCVSRGCYVVMSESRRCSHDGEVVGVACDSTNSLKEKRTE